MNSLLIRSGAAFAAATFSMDSFAAGETRGGPSAPNMIIIVIDDAGYADFGFQGNPQFARFTSSIDSIASRGARFTSGYVSGAVCSPTRAALLTGRYQQRFGHESNPQDFAPDSPIGMPLTQVTLPQVLRNAGYRTYMVGKWHLGMAPEFQPNARGFDEFFGFLGGARSYFAINNPSPQAQLRRNGTLVAEDPNRYLTDRWGDEAVAYVNAHMAEHADQPFFMYLPFNAVHTPVEPDPARLADPRVASINNVDRRNLAAMLLAMDQNVGRVLERLDHFGIRENTIVAFHSDNGGPENDLAGSSNGTSNGPLRGTKGFLYEGGVRVPFSLCWPGTIPAGQVIADPIVQVDLLPTMAAAASAAIPATHVPDGVNLLPRLTGADTTPIARPLFWRTAGSTNGQSAIRFGPWKLVRSDAPGGGTVELFNLTSDLGESTDLADAFPDTVDDLLGLFDDWEQRVIEPLWGTGTPVLSPSSTTLAHTPISGQDGYLLSSENTANGVSLVELRHAYPATAPWSAQFVMEPVSGTSTQRNASVVFGDGPATNALIVAGLQPGTRTLRITESQTGRVATAPYLGSITGPLSCRVAFGVEPASMTLTVGNSSVSLELEGTYASFNHVGYSVSRSSGRFGVVRPVGASPCIADFNGDGGVDSADVEAFFIAWEAGESIADVNADGGVNGDDVGTFFAAWESGGCP